MKQVIWHALLIVAFFALVELLLLIPESQAGMALPESPTRPQPPLTTIYLPIIVIGDVS